MNSLAVFFALIFSVVAEVIHVQVLFRHGDRAPSNVYPSDRYGEEVWPRGFSQLTEQGYRRAQDLGRYLRARYKTRYNLLGPAYRAKEVYVRSSDKDRCIETAMGVTSTMFPSEVVPIHTYSSHKHDLLLKPSSVRCDRADALVFADKQKLYQERNHEYRELFAYISHHTGAQVSMSNIKQIYNTVHRESDNGLPQPSWVYTSTSRNTTVLEEMAELKRQERMETFNSYEKSKLSTGFLLGRLLQEMQDKITGISSKKLMLYATSDNGLPQPLWVYASTSRNTTVLEEMAELKRQERMETFNSYEKSKLSTGFLLGRLLQEVQEKIAGISSRKLMLYATHDATITSLLYNLGVSNHLLPPYTSSVLMELHKIKARHFVKVIKDICILL
ncbi:hypothetical protein OESDEN_16162 [Oesophagostomum dentatum]|uniref:Histidine acid phosphatase n=1 Tax=Oesophagostomum dentatum TaxID=61180 RepID=A0A0B1SFS0_OESDE|nr:hypothetical protein OESDEN_16162 [Oesophagostomum dentatum]